MNPSRSAHSGLYVILDPALCLNRLLADVLQDATGAGATLFQYRNKSVSMKEAYSEASFLRKVAADLGVTFIVNDRCDLALAVDADGVHIGQEDIPYGDARKIMGPEKLIGLSTHNPEQVSTADRLQPDYIGFGPIFTPGAKRDHDPVVGIDGLAQIRSLTTLPIFAIGGITPENVGDVINAGADGVAVISAIVNAPDVRRAVSNFIRVIRAPTASDS